MSLNPKKVSTPERKSKNTIRNISQRDLPKYEVSIREQDNTYIPLYSYAGSRNLSAFADVFLAGDDRKNRKIVMGVEEGVLQSDNLVSLSVTNEKGKHPQVDVSLLVSNYRSTKNTDTRLEDYKLGKNIYVEYGYGTASTRQGPFTVDQKEVIYSDGTAMLQITAKMGRKLSTVTTADVFEASSGIGVIDKLASLAGYKVDYSQISEQEKKQLKRSTSKSTAGNNNVGHKIVQIANGNGLDFYIDTDQNVIKITSPFKRDLVTQGQQPLKITYGFPNSNIHSISIREERKKSKVSGGGSSQKIKLSQGYGGVIGNKGVHKQVVGVTFEDPNGGEGINLGKPISERKFKDDPTTDPNGTTALQKAQKKFPPSSYVLEQDPYVAFQDFVVFNVYKKVRASNLVITETSSVPLPFLTKMLNNPSLVVVITGQPFSDEGLITFPVKKFERVQIKDKTIEDINEVKETQATTQTVSEDQESGVTYAWKTRRGTAIQFLGDKNESQASDYQNRKNIYARAKTEADNNQNVRLVSQVNKDTGATIYFLEDRVEVTPIVKKTESTKNNPPEVSSSDDQNRSQKGPKGAGIKNNTVQSYLSSKELTVNLATGDFFMKVGTLIEIVDMNESLNGVYVIKSCKHDVSMDGFKTSFVCNEALSRQGYSNGTKDKERSTRLDNNNTTTILTTNTVKKKFVQKDTKNQTRVAPAINPDFAL